jgi:hypothetical protein
MSTYIKKSLQSETFKIYPTLKITLDICKVNIHFKIKIVFFLGNA